MKKTGLLIAVIVAAVVILGEVSRAQTGEERPSATDRTGKESASSSGESATDDPARTSKERLLDAYKKEFVFLENEKTSLENRLRQIERERRNAVANREARIRGLQEKLLSLSSEADKMQEKLQKAESKAYELKETSEAVDNIISQARATLEKHGELQDMPHKTTEEKEKALDYVFTKAVSVLESLGDVRKEMGAFFLEDGTEVKGTIIWIGDVAALGVSDKGAGTLAPAGEGHLKLWAPETAEQARLLAQGKHPATLPLYLYESLEKPAQVDKGKTVQEVIKSGGIIAYVIVALGGAALVLIIGRVFFLLRSQSNTTRMVDEISPLIEKGNLDQALKHLQPARGATARVLAATVRNLESDPHHLEDIISESILHETPYLERFESAIMVFAAVAPLLGLLGTVTGMISTFDVITEFGTGDPKLLSGGISEALITTQLGLAVAIPALLIGNLLSGWSERIKTGMENAALRVTNIFKTRRQMSLFDDKEKAGD